MVDRVEQRFQLKPRRLVGDTAYGTAPMLAWMVEQKHIDPHVPVWEKSGRKDDTHDEFLLAATVQNLRRMAKWLGAEQTVGKPAPA